jgi:hypothetical protein
MSETPATTNLLAFVDDEISEELATDLERAVEVASDQRPWPLGPPTFIDETIDGIRTIGCELLIHAARGDRGEPLFSDRDARSLAATKALIQILSPVSGRHHVDIGLEMADETVGWIMSGEPDRLIRDGLIGPWEEHLRAGHSTETAE